MLKNKIALVTGGGKGIGLGITQTLLQYGAKVIIAQRTTLSRALNSNPNVDYIQADFSKNDAPQLLANRIKEKYKNIDIIVNNAGIMFEENIATMSDEQWQKIIQINVTTPVFIVKYLLKVLNKSGASIINIGSIEALAANPAHTAYGASKGALHSATANMALDLGPKNIRVNSIAPGWITSDLAEAYINTQDDPEWALNELIKMHPIGRVGQPTDIGGVVAFLANSDLSGFVTGQVIVVDGGRMSKIPLPF